MTGDEAILDLGQDLHPLARPYRAIVGFAADPDRVFVDADLVRIGEDQSGVQAARVAERVERDPHPDRMALLQRPDRRALLVDQLGVEQADGVALGQGTGTGVGAVPLLFEVQLQVVAADVARVADVLDPTAADQHRAVAVFLHGPHLVGDQDNRLARQFHLTEGVGALLLEGGIADGQYLIDQQDVGVDLQHQREGEPHEHPRGVVLQLQVDEVPEFGEVDHGVEAVARFLRGEAHHHPVEDDVVAGGEVEVEADPELDEGSEATRDPDRPGVGAVDAGEQLQQGALARAVAADDAEELALADLEGDSVERVQLAELARREGVDDPLFQRVQPLGGDAERLVEVFDLEHGRRVGDGRPTGGRSGDRVL